MLTVRTDQVQTAGRCKAAPAHAFLDGAQVTVRPVQHSDLVLIQEMHSRLSRESIYYRYLASHAPDLEALERLCFLDGQAGSAIVATVQEPQEKVVGVACYCVDRRDPTTAEPAILVEDRYQGRGLGKRMLRVLCQQARQRGLEVFACFTHLANGPVLHLIKRSGLRYESSYSQGVREIRVWLTSA